MKVLPATLALFSLCVSTATAVAGARLFVPLENENRILVIDTETGDQAYIGNANPDDGDIRVGINDDFARGRQVAIGIAHDPLRGRLFFVTNELGGGPGEGGCFALYQINADDLTIESRDVLVGNGTDPCGSDIDLMTGRYTGDIEISPDGESLFFAPKGAFVRRIHIDSLESSLSGDGDPDGEHVFQGGTRDFLYLPDGTYLFAAGAQLMYRYNARVPDFAPTILSPQAIYEGAVAMDPAGDYIYLAPEKFPTPLLRFSVESGAIEEYSGSISFDEIGVDLAVGSADRVYILLADGTIQVFDTGPDGMNDQSPLESYDLPSGADNYARLEITPDRDTLFIVSRAADAVYELPLNGDGSLDTPALQTIDLAGAGVAPVYDGIEPVRAVTAVAVNPGDGYRVVAVRGEGVFADYLNGNGWIPRNGGFGNVLPQAARDDVRELQYASGGTQPLYAVTGAGVYLTPDDGNNWYPCNNGIEGLSPTDLTPVSDDGTHAVLVTEYGGTYEKTANCNGQWNPINEGLPLP